MNRLTPNILTILVFAVVSLSFIPQTGFADQKLHSGVVLETMSSGGYTYMQILEKEKTFWVAMPQAAVKTGDTVRFTGDSWMENFTSKTLNRTFKKILFAGSVDSGKNTKQVFPAPSQNSKYKKAGTYSVAEVFSQRVKLNGNMIKVRGKVVKVSKGIMGKNWIHIQDGTGDKGMNDLTFTSPKGLAKVGDVVIASGKLVVDKDFGYGYFYKAIIEGAKFKK